MNVSRLKTIVIIILLLLNLCFLAIYFVDRHNSAVLEAETRSELVQVMAQNGIEIDEAVIPAAEEQVRYTLTREAAKESELVEALLGPAKAEDKGGNIYFYQNETGSAWFRSNGEFEIAILNLPQGDQSASQLSKELLDTMGISFSAGSEETLSVDSTRKTGYACLFEGKTVFDCKVSFTFHADGQTEIIGYRLKGGTPTFLDQDEILSPETALVRFLNEIKSGGNICNKIESMEMGYILSASASANVLEPVWQIATDGGDYYLDCVSGKLVII